MEGEEIMNMIEAVKSVFTQYVGFSGRARRSEYWWFYLANLIVGGILSQLGKNISAFGVLSGLYSLAVLLPALAVAVRRLHDIGKSGWWILLNLIPVVGQIIIIIWMCKDSMPGENLYGPNPKEV